MFARLIADLARERDYDPEVFSLLAEAIQLAEFYKLEKVALGELRNRLDRAWHSGDIKIGDSEIHSLLVEMEVPFIYTTNFDRWLELAQDHHGVPYSRIVNVAGLIKAAAGQTQIVKLHGDFSDDDSLILTERRASHVEERASSSGSPSRAPPDIKLRADSIGRGILFIGYRVAPTTSLVGEA